MLIVVLASPLDIVGPASTTIAAASWPFVFSFLLGPAPIRRVPQLSAIRALVRLTFGTERLRSVFSLHPRSFRTLSLDVLVSQHFNDVPRSKLIVAHFKVKNNVLIALGQTAQQTDRDVFILHLGADAAELRADVEEFIAMMQHIAAFRHLHAE